MTRAVTITLILDSTPVVDAIVTLSDVAGVYGIREAVSDAVVVPAGAPMSHVGGGVYRYDFAGAEPLIAYEATARVTWPDGTVDHYDRPLAASAVDESTHYASRARLERMKGVEVIRQASQAGKGNAADVDRIEAALAEADLIIDEYFRANGYETPIVAEPLRSSLGSIAVQFAYAYLLDPIVFSRGEDGSSVGRDLWFAVRDAKRRMGRLALFGAGDAARLTDAPTFPTPVE